MQVYVCRCAGIYTCMCARQGDLFVPFGAGLPPLGAMPPIESLLGIPTVSLAGTSPSSHCVSTATTASMASAAMMSSVATSTVVSLSAGIYEGEGILPVPAKLVEKITLWEFVEMAELLPEFWSSLASREPGANLGTA